MFTHQLKKDVSGTDSQVTHNLQKLLILKGTRSVFLCAGCWTNNEVLVPAWLAVALPQTILILKYLPDFKHLGK